MNSTIAIITVRLRKNLTPAGEQYVKEKLNTAIQAAENLLNAALKETQLDETITINVTREY